MDLGTRLSNFFQNRVAKPVQQEVQALPQQAATFGSNLLRGISQPLQQFGRGLAQNEVNLEKNVPLYGQFQSGIRQGFAPIMRNFAPQQEVNRYLSFNQQNKSGIGGDIAQMAGTTIPTLPLLIATNGLANPVTTKMASLVPGGSTLATAALSGAAKGAINFAPFSALHALDYAPNIEGRVKNVISSVPENLALGAGFGAVGGAAGHGVKQVIGKLSNVLQVNHGLAPEDAQKVATQFLRDEFGRFTGQRAPIQAIKKAPQFQPDPQFQVPKQGSIEQLMEANAGWKPGMRKQFDTALLNKDAQTIKKLLPDVPEQYRISFSSQIDNVLNGVSQSPLYSAARGKLSNRTTVRSNTLTPTMQSDLRGTLSDLIPQPGLSIKTVDSKRLLAAERKLTPEQLKAQLYKNVPVSNVPGFKETPNGTPPVTGESSPHTKPMQSVGDVLSENKGRYPQTTRQPSAAQLKTNVKSILEPAQLNSNIPNGMKERKFITSVRDSSSTAPQVKEAVQGNYTVKPNEKTISYAKTLIDTNPEEALRVAQSHGPATAESNTVAQLLIDQAQQAGRYEDAINLVEHTAARATKQGQAIQALSMYGRLSPEGILRFAQRTISRANQSNPNLKLKIEPALAKEMRGMAEAIQKMPEGRDKTVKTAQLMAKIADQVPPDILSKISTFQTMAQLLNPKTAIRNLGGNLGFGALDNVSSSVASVLDKGVSLFTKKRSKVMPSISTQLRGGLRGLKEGYQDAKLGIDTSAENTQFDLPKAAAFKKVPILGQLEKAMNIELRAPDRAAYQAAYDDSLVNQMRALKVSTATPEMEKVAHADGLYKTFQDSSVAARVFSGIKKALNLGKPFGLGDIVLKYPKTPGNIIARGIDYSPAGFINSAFTLAKGVLGKGFDQKGFVEQTARALVGSTSLVGGGSMLHRLGIITGQPEKDKDINAVQREAGLGGYKVNASALERFILSGMDPKEAELRPGDKLVSYDWFQPAAIGISMGANIDEKMSDPKSKLSTALEALAGGSNTLAEQPLIKNFTKVFSNPQGLSQALLDTVKDAPASFIPTLSNQIRQIVDNTSRDTTNPDFATEAINRVTTKIPGLSQTLPALKTVYGDNQQVYQNGSNNWFNVFLNPAFVSEFKNNPATDEVLNVFNRSGEVQQAPHLVSSKIKVNGQDMQLTPDQKGMYQEYVGKMTKQVFSDAINQPTYQAMSDPDKAKYLSGLLTDINTSAKIALFGDKPKTIDQGVRLINQGGYKLPTSDTTPQFSVKNGQIIQKLAPTGSELAKIENRKVAAEYTKQIDDTVALWEAGKLSTNEAEARIKSIKLAQSSTKGTGIRKGRKIKALKLPKVKFAAMKTAKIKSPKSFSLKSKAPKFVSLKFKPQKAQKA